MLRKQAWDGLAVAPLSRHAAFLLAPYRAGLPPPMESAAIEEAREELAAATRWLEQVRHLILQRRLAGHASPSDLALVMEADAAVERAAVRLADLLAERRSE